MHLNKIKILLSALLFLQIGICNAQLSESNYRIYSVKLGKEVTLNEIVADMDQHNVLFFGEEHDDSVTHFLENKMLELLYARFPGKMALSMEMFDRDVQPIMNEYLLSDIREKNFKKEARVWSNYKDYKPMVEFAKKNRMDIVCANAAGRYTNLVGRKGQDALKALPEASRLFFAPVPFDTASGKYLDKLNGLSNHTPSADTSKKTVAPPAMNMGGFNMILAQSLWDATMAYSIATYFKKHKDFKVMQVNGRFHSDEGFGIVTQLKNYNSKLKPLIISTASDDAFPAINWSNYSTQGDYIIITDPKVPRSYK